MKFISKSLRLTITLKFGLPPQPLIGVLAAPGLHVKFIDGQAEVLDPEAIDLMLKHPGFNKDYVVAEESKRNPYEGTRKEAEPRHTGTEIEYGHFGEKTTDKKDNGILSEQKDLILKMASEMAKSMAKDIIKEFVANQQTKPAEPAEIPVIVPTEPEQIESEEDVAPVATKELKEAPVKPTSFACSKGCGKTSISKVGIMAHERFCKYTTN